jgi:hypothetical protein
MMGLFFANNLRLTFLSYPEVDGMGNDIIRKRRTSTELVKSNLLDQSITVGLNSSEESLDLKDL